MTDGKYLLEVFFFFLAEQMFDLIKETLFGFPLLAP